MYHKICYKMYEFSNISPTLNSCKSDSVHSFYHQQLRKNLQSQDCWKYLLYWVSLGWWAGLSWRVFFTERVQQRSLLQEIWSPDLRIQSWCVLGIPRILEGFLNLAFEFWKQSIIEIKVRSVWGDMLLCVCCGVLGLVFWSWI